MHPQRLVVPLFQRQYVWNQDNQWEPLWNDVVRVASRLIAQPQERPSPHFLGAVVLQQIQNPVGSMQTRTIIDGQQRLTTLQLLLDALHAELIGVGATQPAARLEPLVANAQPFWSHPEDRFKVWPTNRDRGPFNAVMVAEPPVDHDKVAFSGERIVEAHRFFSEQARAWLPEAADDTRHRRAAAIELVVRELLQMVVIDLGADENAQEIFETLNARGAQLTAADLIKNFVFQRLSESNTNIEGAYEQHWKEFEAGFWETELNVGRAKHQRSSVFLNHWLVSRTAEEIVAREVFYRFKRFADHDSRQPMISLLEQIHRASQVYRQYVTASTASGPIDRLGLFGYRTGVLESEVIKPLILSLLDPEQTSVPADQFGKALNVVESWMVRRMLVRATTKNYNQVVGELIARVRDSGRMQAGDAIEDYLKGQSGDSRYWPDDDELRRDLPLLPVYRRLSRSRLRMVLEAIEDHLRGWKNGNSGFSGERVARGRFAIEHVMPRKWMAHWPLPASVDEASRERLIHTIGNLTLLTGRLNSKVSNGPWFGPDGKHDGIRGHDVLFLNKGVLDLAVKGWTDDLIRARTDSLVDLIIQIWPVPAGHRSATDAQKPRTRRKKIPLLDLITAGVLHSGMTLYPRRPKFRDKTVTLLADGRIEVDGHPFGSPTDAARAITGRTVSGWWFFFTDLHSRQTLRRVRREYVEAMAEASENADAEEEEEGEEEEDE